MVYNPPLFRTQTENELMMSGELYDWRAFCSHSSCSIQCGNFTGNQKWQNWAVWIMAKYNLKFPNMMNHVLSFKTHHRMLIKSGSAKSTFVGDWWLQSSSIRKSKVMINCYVISFHFLFLEGIWTFILKIYCCLQSASEWCQFYQRQKKRKLLVLQKLRSAPHTIREHIFAVQLKGKNLSLCIFEDGMGC